jgi:hypothetical protein
MNSQTPSQERSNPNINAILKNWLLLVKAKPPPYYNLQLKLFLLQLFNSGLAT